MIDLRHTLDTSGTRPVQKLFRFGLEYNLRRIASKRKLLGHFLRAVRLYLDADSAWLHRIRVDGESLRKPMRDGAAPVFDESLVEAFAAQEEPALPNTLLLAPLRLQGRLVGVVGASRADGFARGKGYELLKLCAVLAAEMAEREEARVREVLSGIKEEILREIRPKDVAYQILDGLRQLVSYDHSAALLLYDAAASVFHVEAEKIAWTKAPSRFIGLERPVSPGLANQLRHRGSRLVREGGAGPEGAVILEPSGELAEVLAYPGEPEPGSAPAATSTLGAPLVFRGELLGLLRVAAWRRPRFNAWDAEVVHQFLLAAANSLWNARARLDQERQAVEAARSGQLVSVARVVAHDVNNAIGTILPLAQQAVEELGEGRPDPAVLREDLALIVEKAELCRGIFSRLLQQVGSVSSKHRSADLNRAVKDRRDLLEASLRRRGVDLELRLAPGLPHARIYRQHLEHVVWNLVHNALDALPFKGGRIVVSTSKEPGGLLRLQVEDNGRGIPPEDRERVFEPFFSTKRQGTGLGLPLCLNLVRESGGTLSLESHPGRGTVVTVGLPADPSAEESEEGADTEPGEETA